MALVTDHCTRAFPPYRSLAYTINVSMIVRAPKHFITILPYNTLQCGRGTCLYIEFFLTSLGAFSFYGGSVSLFAAITLLEPASRCSACHYYCSFSLSLMGDAVLQLRAQSPSWVARYVAQQDRS